MSSPRRSEPTTFQYWFHTQYEVVYLHSTHCYFCCFTFGHSAHASSKKKRGWCWKLPFKSRIGQTRCRSYHFLFKFQKNKRKPPEKATRKKNLRHKIFDTKSGPFPQQLCRSLLHPQRPARAKHVHPWRNRPLNDDGKTTPHPLRVQPTAPFDRGLTKVTCQWTSVLQTFFGYEFHQQCRSSSNTFSIFSFFSTTGI